MVVKQPSASMAYDEKRRRNHSLTINEAHLATKVDIADVRTEIANVRTELAQLETRMVKMLYGTLFAAVVSGIVGIVGVLLQLFTN